MTTILVTGGAGFVGSSLVGRLLEVRPTPHVIVIDNYFTGRRENLDHLLENKNLELIRHDVTLPIYLEADQIYHLACPASPVHYSSNPIKTIKTNILGTLNFLGMAKRVRARFLLASTSEVYGDPLVHPQKEGYWGNVNPLGPRSCYDEGKRLAESLTINYCISHQVQGKIARIFNTYGPRMLFEDGRVVSNFILQALQNKPLTIYGNGQQTRSFCYVTDLVDGLIKLMNKDNFLGPVNLGNPNEITISELAKLVIELTGSKSQIEQMPLPTDDPLRRQPDITLAKDVLGWQATVALKDGLLATINDFQSRLSKIQ